MKSQNKAKSSLLLAILMLSTIIVLSAPGPAQAATVVLDPNGAGSKTDLSKSGAATNWQAAETDDGDTSYVYTDHPGYKQDFYNLTDVSLTGTINSVTVYIRARAAGTPTQQSYKITVKTHDETHKTAPGSLTDVYATYSTAYTENPETLALWTWDEINALQAGVDLRRAASGVASRCTRVWVVVDYTDFEGLSHGYWKNHPGDWAATGYNTSDTLESVFDIPDSFGLDDYTLLEALNFPGGDSLAEKAQILLRNAVASLLNAAHPNINYPLSVAEVIEDVNDALATENAETMLALEAILDGYNNLGGDISS